MRWFLTTLLQSKISTQQIILNVPVWRAALLFILRKQSQQVNKIIIIIIYLTANGLSPGGSGYNACT